MKPRKTYMAFIIGLSIVFLVLFFPQILVYTNRPVKSDAIILFAGPDFKNRQQEAYQLLEEGYARFLLIPNNYQVFQMVKTSDKPLLNRSHPAKTDFIGQTKQYASAKPGGMSILVPVPINLQFISGIIKKRSERFEDTHLEILIAREMMKQLHLKSAIFVSSPHHMLRIRIIAVRVFHETLFPAWQGRKSRDGFMLTFVPSRYSDASGNMLSLIRNNRNLKYIYLEYIKIIWFLIYQPFTGCS